MNYNQLTYHKASPFYRQGYLPDRAWYNRKPKQFPSEIPSGQEYFTDSGRKHYNGRFNHSQIQETGVLKSPEKYPYQNRIAMDKTYMRNLDTTDIEGAGSGTRVNEAVRYKLRAQEQLARRYHQSLDLRENKEHEYEEKRRQLAIKQLQSIKNKKSQKVKDSLENSSITNNPEQRYRSIDVNHPQQHVNSKQQDNKFITLLPKPYYKGLEHEPKEPKYVSKYIEPLKRQQSDPLPASSPPQNKEHITSSAQLDDHLSHVFNASDRHKSNPAYVSNYDHELQRRREEYRKTIELDHAAYNQLTDRKQFRKHNPTNLSFSLAGQSVVGGR